MVWRCATCGTVFAWKLGFYLKAGIWWNGARIAWTIGTLGMARAVCGSLEPGKFPWEDAPYKNEGICPSCGTEGSLGSTLACWVPSSRWYWPPSWGKGGWLLQTEFQKMLTGSGDLDGKEVSLVVHSGGKTP
jgi:rubredoxin